jgi:hypothetical protein
MSRIIVSGALANKPFNAGGAWERLSWMVGLRRLGVDAHFVEQIAPESCVDGAGRRTSFHESVNLEWFQAATAWFGVADRSALVCVGGEQCAGMSWERLLEIAAAADLLVNLSGHLTISRVVDRVARKAYIDVDPGFTQFWHVDPATRFELRAHDFYFTIGENIGSPDCPIPTGGIPWRPTRQPVVLDDWPIADADVQDRFTTVASWRGPFGAVRHNGRTFGLKVHEFRKFIELPERSRSTFEIALAIDPTDDRDLQSLRANRWRIVDPKVVAADPPAFRRYIQQSAAEFSVAQGVYVDTDSGWFSDRTVRYLASGKPVLVQDTGFSRNLPTGEGLVAFRTFDEAVEGAQRITSDYEAHCQAARAIAVEYFHSDRVLRRLLDDVGLVP